MRYVLAILICLSGGLVAATAAIPTDATIPAYHGDPARSGDYVMPGLTWETAHALRRDTSFDGRVDGHVYAQPLYLEANRRGAWPDHRGDRD